MTDTGFKCTKCGGQTRRGFIAERDEVHNFVARWVEGEPVNAELFGIKGVNVNIQNRNMFDVRSLRCDQCGFLELYAV